MSDFQRGDRVVVLRLDSDEIECHGRYAGETGPIVFVQVDDDELPDPVEVGADRVFPEKRRRPAGLAVRTYSSPMSARSCRSSVTSGSPSGNMRSRRATVSRSNVRASP